MAGSHRAVESPDLDPAAVVALQQLGAAYWFCADVSQEGIGGLFAEDAVLILGSLELSGRVAIETFFREREASMRAAGRTTRHAPCSFLVTSMDDACARIRSTVLVFAGSGSLPLPASVPAGIADFTDVCVRSDSGRWQYARREGRTVFIGPDAPAFAR